MNAKMEGQAEHSFADLPLNVLISILSNLHIKDLENVSKTCKILRYLANKKLIPRTGQQHSTTAMVNSKRNSTSLDTDKVASISNVLFTIANRKVVIDVFNLLNNNRSIIERLNYKHRILIFESIKKLRVDYNLIYENPIKDKINDTINEKVSEKINKDVVPSPDSKQDNDDSLLDFNDTVLIHNDFDPMNSININEAELRTENKKDTNLKTCIYGTLNSKPIELTSFDATIELFDDDSFENEQIEEKNFKKINSIYEMESQYSEPLTKSFFSTTNKNTNFDEQAKNEVNTNFTESVLSASTTIRKDSSNKDSSTNYNNTTSTISEVDNFPDTDQLLRSIKSINELRTTKKVKEKAALFEKLFSRESASLGDILMNNDTYNTLINSLPSLQHLEEMGEEEINMYNTDKSGLMDENENTALHLQIESDETSHRNKKNISQNYLDNLKAELVKSNSHEHKEEMKSESNKFIRTKLKAIINGDNKISYQRI
ncbi:hypothetical protein TPHA_0C02110 [Tetrapisispora phaffii CBS 4417]|uniref:F-box domain-containing protein n=1 Tax=Tetrapisispora phaffii (strain ATCC 24235 / CBS 4417 / NBRC 1672 / NRRL Y-8282 / UCD 70-5) TaxID=1071381 RepID=G8BRJ0_TETPH|nr:hypothetical protein TPHA_0C02110 [Tetrapisispora phaffii CBS 4417]CCE62366.1 hypothetical protein TPHA_0C02110 [Tetrapisispora phaffii CBS 4417]